eukprot:GHVU01113286.1.p1 GENE.GHVU01113286.1~~GHVU01113286.1.p1  ORF type:complete len:186 (+),score=41.28 GHVU01113286.1:914-1471(+)
MSSLKEICKNRILDEMVRTVEGGYFALVVDQKTLRVISACLKLYDILQEGVTVVEMIHKKRQPLPSLDAVYFLSPDSETVKILCDDFRNAKKPMYKSVSLFFSGPIGSESGIMEQIAATTALIQRLHNIVEFNLDFVPHEQRVFHLERPLSMAALYPSIREESLYAISNQASQSARPAGSRSLAR